MNEEADRESGRQDDLRLQRWAVLGVVVLLLGAVFISQAFRSTSPRPADSSDVLPPPMKPSPVGQYRGISLQLHTNELTCPFERYVQEIAETGANTIVLSLAAYQENGSASSLFIEYRRVPSAERFEKLIHLAHKRGLRVVIMPMVLLENPTGGEWRGKIKPTKPDQWWEDYENFILYYARIGQRGRAEMLMVGTELISMEEETKRWRALIKKVRKVFKGQLSYSANWDHYEVVQWWDALDVIGMTAYYDLVGENKPSLQVLLNSWKPIKKNILKWQKTIGRPIVFTEVGWPSQVGCAKEPWNYYGSTTPDLVTQDLCLQAFFKTWQDEPVVRGVLLWEWRNAPGQNGGPLDTSYVPIGKPAMDTMRKFFQRPGAASRSRPASRAATAPAG